MKHKHWFLLALVLAGLAAGVLLQWFEDSPSTEPGKSGSAEEWSQVEPENPKLSFGPDEQETATQVSARGPDSAAEQANSSAQADVSASNPLMPAKVYRADSDFPDDEEPEEFIIGGLVQDEAGNPLPNFEVLAERIGDSDDAPAVADLTIENEQSIFSAIDGAFFFRHLEDGEYRVHVAPAEDILPAKAIVRAGTLNVILVVVKLRDVLVYGTVDSGDGEPIKGVRITSGPATRHTTTGTNGEYQLYVSRQGADVRHTIRFQHEEFRQQQILIDPADLDELTIDFQLDVSMEPLKRRTTITGSLTDMEGYPLSDKTLHLVTPGLRTWYSAKSDASGNFIFKNIEPGKDHQLRIRPGSGYKNKDINPLVVPDGGLNLDIVLESLDQGELSGWMIDLDGNPIPGFSLTLRSTVATAQSVSVASDQYGFFSVEGFPVGDAHFRTNSYPVLLVQGIRVSPEPEDPITVILDTGIHVLEGWVVNRLGEPVAASKVRLGWEFSDSGLRSSSTRESTTDQSGYFVFTSLGPSLHTMQVSAAGFKDAVLTIDVGIDPNEIVVELEE
jgi:hypothetical protein